MKITIIINSNDPYAIHFTNIAEQIKRGLATFKYRQEGNQVEVVDQEYDITVTVEETEVSDG